MHAHNQFLNSQSSSGRGPTSVDVAGVVDLRPEFGVSLRTSGGGVSGGRGRRSDVEWRSGVVILLAPGSGLLMFGGWVVGGWGWWSSGFLSCRPEHTLIVLSQSGDSSLPSSQFILHLGGASLMYSASLVPPKCRINHDEGKELSPLWLRAIKVCSGRQDIKPDNHQPHPPITHPPNIRRPLPGARRMTTPECHSTSERRPRPPETSPPEVRRPTLNFRRRLTTPATSMLVGPRPLED